MVQAIVDAVLFGIAAGRDGKDQLVAFGKSILTNGGYTVRNTDVFKFTAMIECEIANGGDACGDGNLLQVKSWLIEKAMTKNNDHKMGIFAFAGLFTCESVTPGGQKTGTLEVAPRHAAAG